MKKLNLQLGSIKEMLTKEQMKKVAGGYDTNFICYFLDSQGAYTLNSVDVPADNCCEAQGKIDAFCFSTIGSPVCPYGADCPCDMNCN